jgi:hypothetical protein
MTWWGPAHNPAAAAVSEAVSGFEGTQRFSDTASGGGQPERSSPQLYAGYQIQLHVLSQVLPAAHHQLLLR